MPYYVKGIERFACPLALPFSSCVSNLYLQCTVQGQYIPGLDTRWTKTISAQEVCRRPQKTVQSSPSQWHEGIGRCKSAYHRVSQIPLRSLVANNHSQRLIGHYTTIDHESDVMLGAIKIDLNRNLGNFVEDVQQEVDWCFNTIFPPCEGTFTLQLSGRIPPELTSASRLDTN